MSTQRYAGKPLLRLLELYVLRAIGKLPRGDRKRLRSMEPQLREAYGVDGAWHEIIASVMSFPPGFEDTLADLWRGNVAGAKAAGCDADPEAFAAAVTDKNFT